MSLLRSLCGLSRMIYLWYSVDHLLASAFKLKKHLQHSIWRTIHNVTLVLKLHIHTYTFDASCSSVRVPESLALNTMGDVERAKAAKSTEQTEDVDVGGRNRGIPVDTEDSRRVLASSPCIASSMATLRMMRAGPNP